ncbi:MAG: DUF4147 domain-containing protein [Firmicutes bacterium]|jgi:glycerate 2-kinase|nr:DUF4147 domain-containing protein [Bacillota bacterium]
MQFEKIKNYDEILSHGEAEAKEVVLKVTDEVLNRLDIYKYLKNLIKLDGNTLTIGKKVVDLNNYDRIYAFSSGKAGNHMARAFEEILGDKLTAGVTIIKIKEDIDVQCLKKTEIFVGGHPLPNEEGVEGCKRMIELAEQMNERDLLLLGLTGGCSALMGYPVEGVSLDDLKEATDVMLKNSMWVMDINDIRGHLSRMSRGRLGQKIKGAKIFCFEIWDAVGLDDITDYTEPVPIMGTPVGYDTITFEDIRAIIKKYNIEDKLPASVANYLMNSGPEEETPQEMTNDVDYYVTNTLPDSCKHAMDIAKEMGVEAHILTTYASGESKDFGTFMATLAKEIQMTGNPFKAPCLIFSAGETTTAIGANDEITGHGGPSQELVTSFAIAADELGLKNVAMLSMDSEGTDGTCKNAGGITDGTTMKTALGKDVDLRRFLEGHACYEALTAVGDGLFTGNTGTNLCDFNVLYVGKADK